MILKEIKVSGENGLHRNMYNKYMDAYAGSVYLKSLRIPIASPRKKYFVKVYSHVSIFKNTFKSFTEEKIVFIALKQFN